MKPPRLLLPVLLFLLVMAPVFAEPNWNVDATRAKTGAMIQKKDFAGLETLSLKNLCTQGFAILWNPL